jgi:hypothetical protein
VVRSFVARATWNAHLDAWPDEIAPVELTPRLLEALDRG